MGRCLDSSNETTIAENVEVAKTRQNDPGHDLKDEYSTVVNHTLIVCVPAAQAFVHLSVTMPNNASIMSPIFS